MPAVPPLSCPTTLFLSAIAAEKPHLLERTKVAHPAALGTIVTACR